MLTNSEKTNFIADSADGVNRPKYQRIRDYFFKEIRTGRFTPGQLLPSESNLVKSLGISRYTIRQALSELENEGVIHRVQGSGTFVSTIQQRQSKQQLDLFALIAPQLREGCYPSLIQGFDEACKDYQHQTLVGNSGDDVARQGDLILQMIDQSIGGIAIVPTTSPETPAYQIRQLHKNQIPVVFCHRVVEGVSAPSVIFKGHEIGMKAAQMVLTHGHKRMVILSAHTYSMMSDREQGARQAFVEAGLDPNGVKAVDYHERHSAPASTAVQAIKKTMDELLALPDRPTAVFCSNAPDAEVVYQHVKSRGLQIPRDISLLYFGTTWREHGLGEMISSVAVDEHNIGVCAANLLNEMRVGKRPLDNKEQIVFPVLDLPGETVGPAPSGS